MTNIQPSSPQEPWPEDIELKKTNRLTQLFSSTIASLSRFFGLWSSKKAQLIKNEFKEISDPSLKDLSSRVTHFVAKLRDKPFDISLKEAASMRFALMNKLKEAHDYVGIIEKFADVRERGSPREQQLWRDSYDHVVHMNETDKDPEVRALLMKHCLTRYATPHYEKKVGSFEAPVERENLALCYNLRGEAFALSLIRDCLKRAGQNIDSEFHDPKTDFGSIYLRWTEILSDKELSNDALKTLLQGNYVFSKEDPRRAVARMLCETGAKNMARGAPQSAVDFAKADFNTLIEVCKNMKPYAMFPHLFEQAIRVLTMPEL